MKHGHGQLVLTLTSSHYDNCSRVCQDQDDLLSFLFHSQVAVDPPEGKSVLVVLVCIVWVVMVLVTIVVILAIVV